MKLSPTLPFTQQVIFNYLHQVDVAIIEVGVGGRTDATNVIVGEANGIATIGYDHCNVLGPTLTDIAYEKSGIFKVPPQSIK